MRKDKIPTLKGHVIAFKGRRFWVIQIDEEHPFGWVTSEFGELAVYDLSCDLILGYASRKANGAYRCTVLHGQSDHCVEVERLQDIGRAVHALNIDLDPTGI